jgi:hypothetical protein
MVVGTMMLLLELRRLPPLIMVMLLGLEPMKVGWEYTMPGCQTRACELVALQERQYCRHAWLGTQQFVESRQERQTAATCWT